MRRTVLTGWNQQRTRRRSRLRARSKGVARRGHAFAWSIPLGGTSLSPTSRISFPPRWVASLPHRGAGRAGAGTPPLRTREPAGDPERRGGFLGLHGGRGRMHGSGSARRHGVPYTGSGSLASGLAMDKAFPSVVFPGRGCSHRRLADDPRHGRRGRPPIGMALVVKPSKQVDRRPYRGQGPLDYDAAVELAGGTTMRS